MVQIGEKDYITQAKPEDDGYFDGELPFSPFIRPVCLPCNGFVTKDMLNDENGTSLVTENMNEDELCELEGNL